MSKSNRDYIPREDWYGNTYLGGQFVRLASYRQQLLYALAHRPRAVLLVGKGDGLVVDLLRQSGVKVVVLDLERTLRPDVLGTVEQLPFAPGAFDLCLCCQVLEHLPFERFGAVLAELRRVVRGRLVLSLPDVRRFVSLRFSLLGLRLDWQASLPRWRCQAISRERLEELGHYWEIGFLGYDNPKVVQAVRQSGWRVLETRRVPDLPWHTFFHCAADGGPPGAALHL
jgi:SAM-dependent methyltransferase